mmetsp:Transcript_1033/g.2198  ORF Transcript_1033/g.2198 Transcript_1033/m.2198 type:complete len:146 (+) Transcript_1033:406-843(+)
MVCMHDVQHIFCISEEVNGDTGFLHRAESWQDALREISGIMSGVQLSTRAAAGYSGLTKRSPMPTGVPRAEDPSSMGMSTPHGAERGISVLTEVEGGRDWGKVSSADADATRGGVEGVATEAMKEGLGCFGGGSHQTTELIVSFR